MKTQKANQIISYVSLFGYSCGDYAFAFCACLLVSFCITLTACGGGGSSITGGGNTGISGVGAVSEFRAQSGLALVSAASAYHGGHDGQSVKVGSGCFDRPASRWVRFTGLSCGRRIGVSTLFAWH